MALRLIEVFEDKESGRAVKVYRDTEWQEFRARLVIGGVSYPQADSFDDDKESIMGTAKAMLACPHIPTCPTVALRT